MLKLFHTEIPLILYTSMFISQQSIFKIYTANYKKTPVSDLCMFNLAKLIILE